MMFDLKWEKRALRELHKLNQVVALRIYKKVGSLKSGFNSIDVRRMQGSNDFRLRIGNYRVLFSLEK